MPPLNTAESKTSLLVLDQPSLNYHPVAMSFNQVVIPPV